MNPFLLLVVVLFTNAVNATESSCEFPTLWGEGLWAMVDRIEKLSESNKHEIPHEKTYNIALEVAQLNGLPYSNNDKLNNNKKLLKYPGTVKWPESLKKCEKIHINVLTQVNDIPEQDKLKMRQSISLYIEQRLEQYSRILYQPIVEFNSTDSTDLTLNFKLTSKKTEQSHCLGSAALTRTALVTTTNKTLLTQLCNAVDNRDDRKAGQLYVSPWLTNNLDAVGGILWSHIEAEGFCTKMGGDSRITKKLIQRFVKEATFSSTNRVKWEISPIIQDRQAINYNDTSKRYCMDMKMVWEAKAHQQKYNEIAAWLKFPVAELFSKQEL